ncbi:hypothetical protein AB6A40_008644 [Gnathostoma spinigerum]|uniref:Uncharacterized protein n=1 Tax=Gnathostoma spinigerum TaxID=75299 RepID=A0ABD6EPP0_9BILA
MSPGFQSPWRNKELASTAFCVSFDGDIMHSSPFMLQKPLCLVTALSLSEMKRDMKRAITACSTRRNANIDLGIRESGDLTSPGELSSYDLGPASLLNPTPVYAVPDYLDRSNEVILFLTDPKTNTIKVPNYQNYTLQVKFLSYCSITKGKTLMNSLA